MTDRPGEEWERIWNMPRKMALNEIRAVADGTLSLASFDDEAAERALAHIDYLVHTTRERIFHDARELNRSKAPPSKRQPVTLEDLA